MEHVQIEELLETLKRIALACEIVARYVQDNDESKLIADDWPQLPQQSDIHPKGFGDWVKLIAKPKALQNMQKRMRENL